MKTANQQNKTAGIVLILLASVIWAVEPVLAKLSYRSGGDFFQTIVYRAVVVAAVGLAYALISAKGKFLVSKKEMGAIAYIMIVASLFAETLFYYALTMVPVINSVMIAHLQPVFIVLFGFFIVKEERLTWSDYTGMIVMILAGVLVTTRTGENIFHLKIGTFGDLLVLFSTIAWATTALAMRKYLAGVNSGVIILYRYLFVAVILFPVLALIGRVQPPNIYQAVLGLVIGVGAILYIEGMKRMQAALVSSVELSTPFFAAVFSFVFLGETITLMQGAGVLLLAAGIVFLSRKTKKKPVF